MTTWTNYYLAKSPEDALQALSQAPGPARLIGGGSDLLLELTQGLRPPVHTLVDVTGVPEMTKLEIREGQLYIGAAAPLKKIVSSSLVQEHAMALHEAAALIGGPQVRNTATLGGNVAHALPAADGTISLLSLNAQALIANISGMRLASLESLFLGPGRSALEENNELLVGFHLPLKSAGVGSAFRRVMRPQGVAIAILNMSAWVQRQGEKMVEVRIGVGPGGPVPFRARSAEAILRGQAFTCERFQHALDALQAEVRFRTSPHRATSQYRHEVASSLLDEVLSTAWQRAAE
jgi:xanthine dehydrogenase FAD-binding subunit